MTRLRMALACALLLPGLCTAAVPLVEGLTVTTAVADAHGDYESRKRLVAREGDGWRLGYSVSLPGADGKPQTFDSERLLHDADLQSARTYRSRFEANVEEDYPGTTALGASSMVLKELHDTGRSRYALVGEDRWMADALASLPGARDSALALAGALMAGNGISFKGELQRQSTGTLSVLVNGQPQALPTLVASGRFSAKNGQTMDAELSFLDETENPIALQWRIGAATLRVVRLDFSQAAEKSGGLAAALKEQKRITLPGLYFDFGSATLRPESAASLRIIAEAARTAPGALLLEGHTDNIGDAARNLALSRARAEAVRVALIALDPDLTARLESEGHGAARPQASNATLEGRAQNRRVELVIR